VTDQKWGMGKMREESRDVTRDVMGVAQVLEEDVLMGE